MKSGPVGEGDYIVEQGDCFLSIAQRSGHFWETIWKDPANSKLRSERKDPTILLEGDRLTIPPLAVGQTACQTEKRHQFTRRGTPAKLKLRILEDPLPQHEETEGPSNVPNYSGRDVTSEDQEVAVHSNQDRPRRGVPYRLVIDGRNFDGKTDEDGSIEHLIPPDARAGTLILEPGTLKQQEFELRLGHLDPISEMVGVKERLANLSFECGDRSDEMTDGLQHALRAFQEKWGLPVTGELTEEVRSKIQEVHGS
jgi:hypothetical protein